MRESVLKYSNRQNAIEWSKTAKTIRQIQAKGYQLLQVGDPVETVVCIT